MGLPEQTVSENMGVHLTRMAADAESLRAHADDLAVLLLRGEEALSPAFFCEDWFVARYRALRRESEPAAPAATDGEGSAAALAYGMQALSGAMLARAILTRAAGRTNLSEAAAFAAVSERDVFLYAENRGRVVCLPNALSETAFARFARVLPNLSASSLTDANEICEEVAGGRAGYAILPVESSVDGELKRFASIIDKYALKRVLTCSVQDADRETFTRFALLSRTMEVADAGRQGAETFFSCSLPMSDPSRLFDVLYAAEYFGLRLSRVHAVPFAHNSTGATFFAVFSRTAGDDLLGFFCYLSLEQNGFLPTGNYTQLK